MIHKQARAKITSLTPSEEKMIRERFKAGTKIREGVVTAVEVIQGGIIVVFEAVGNMVSTVFGVIHDFCQSQIGNKPTLLLS
jgi:phage-related protein